MWSILPVKLHHTVHLICCWEFLCLLSESFTLLGTVKGTRLSPLVGHLVPYMTIRPWNRTIQQSCPNKTVQPAAQSGTKERRNYWCSQGIMWVWRAAAGRNVSSDLPGFSCHSSGGYHYAKNEGADYWPGACGDHGNKYPSENMTPFLSECCVKSSDWRRM